MSFSGQCRTCVTIKIACYLWYSIYRSKNSRARRKSTRDYHKNVIWQSRATYTTAWLFNHNYSSRNKAVLRLNYQNKEVILPSLKLWPDLMIPFLSKYPPLPYVPNGSLNVITTQAIRSRFQTVRKSSFPNLKKIEFSIWNDRPCLL